MLTIADISDALVARDRPYKKGHAERPQARDPRRGGPRRPARTELVELFVAERIFERAATRL